MLTLGMFTGPKPPIGHQCSIKVLSHLNFTMIQTQDQVIGLQATSKSEVFTELLILKPTSCRGHEGCSQTVV